MAIFSRKKKTTTKAKAKSSAKKTSSTKSKTKKKATKGQAAGAKDVLAKMKAKSDAGDCAFC